MRLFNYFMQLIFKIYHVYIFKELREIAKRKKSILRPPKREKIV